MLEDLLSTLPQQVVGAAELWSSSLIGQTIPTAVDLVSRFSGANGNTVAVVAEVKRLPFVSPMGADRWKIGSPEREILAGRLERNDADLARQVDAYLAERLAADANHSPAKRLRHASLDGGRSTTACRLTQRVGFLNWTLSSSERRQLDSFPTCGQRSS